MTNKWIDKDLMSIDMGTERLSLFQLSLPIFLNLISSVLISFVQTIAAKKYLDGFFIVPITIATTGFSFLQTIVMLVGTGASILLSVYLGKKEYAESKKIVGTALIISLSFSLALAILGFVLSKPLLMFMGMNKSEYEVYQPYALTIFKFRMLELVIWSVGNVALACLRCYGYTRVGFFAGLVSNVVNIVSVIIALFVICISKEIAAIIFALISIGSAIIFTAIGILYFCIKKIPVDFKVSLRWTKKIFEVGIPAGISQIFYSLSQIVTTSICTSLPESAYLAKTYMQQIIQFVYRFGYSIGQANAIMIGRLCGMNELGLADRLHRQNMKIVLICNIVFSLICMIFGKQFLSWFFGADESILAFSYIFFIDLAVEIGRGMNHVGENGLNAAGDVKYTTIISILSCWVFGVGLAYLFVIVFKWSLLGLWLAFVIDELFRGISYYIRWRKQSWKKAYYKMTDDKSG